MTERLPDNLAVLYDAFGRDAIGNLFPGDRFEVDGVTFVCSYEPSSTAERFYIVKPMPLVERYHDLGRHVAGGTIVELGIAEGGSTALLALLARPERLVAVDLEPEPLEALTELLERRGLTDAVRPRYGVDQADREGLAAVVDEELDGRAIDLVIDDASHHHDPTRTSFEVLFPRLREGGLYLIEDWHADQSMRQAVVNALRDPDSPHHEQVRAAFRRGREADAAPAPARTPLHRFALELSLAAASAHDAVAHVGLDRWWIAVRRGPGTLDPGRFRVEDLYTDHFGLLVPLEG